MPDLKRFEHLLFGNFLCARFDHHDLLERPRDHEIQSALFQLLVRGIHDELPLYKSDARGAERRRVRDIRNHERRRGRVHGEDLGHILAVNGQHGHRNLDFVQVIFRKKRPNGPVDQTGGQDLLFGGASFALEKTAGDLPRGISAFAIIHGQRKKITDFLLVASGDHGRQDHRSAALREDGAMGLLGHTAGFQGHIASPDLSSDFFDLCHERLRLSIV